jgi:DNA-binding GntR family transcriptional regulator
MATRNTTSSRRRARSRDVPARNWRVIDHARRPDSGTAPQSLLRQQAYERLRLEIVTFGLRPGEFVSESQLASSFELGMAAVRAALLRLSQEGLVIPQHRRGHMIAPITIQDIQQTYFLRLQLEPAAAELAAGRIDIALLRRIEQESGGMTRPADKRAHLRSLNGNRDLHLAVAEAAGNPRLLSWIRQLHDQSFRLQYVLRHSEQQSDGAASGHDPIIEALEAGDPARARVSMAEHILQGQALTMQAILARQEIQTAAVFTGL